MPLRPRAKDLCRSNRLVADGHCTINAKRPVIAGQKMRRQSGVEIVCSRGKAIRRDFSSLRAATNVLRQAARVEELSDFAVAMVRLGIDFSIRRISSAKIPDVAT